MRYRIWSKSEKEALLAENKKDIIKFSIELALALPASFVALKYLNVLSIEETMQKLIFALGNLAVIGIDLHAFYGWVLSVLDRDDIIYSNRTSLYGAEDIQGKRR